jgi:hypothetical protein
LFLTVKNLCFSCGGKRTRTADIRRAKAALYQLSYTPVGPFWI